MSICKYEQTRIIVETVYACQTKLRNSKFMSSKKYFEISNTVMQLKCLSIIRKSQKCVLREALILDDLLCLKFKQDWDFGAH